MLEVKICGLNDAAAVAAAVDGGARYLGFVFFPPSPRAIAADHAARLGLPVPASVQRVSLFVDADDAAIGAVLDVAPFEMLQLHGRESPERVMEVRRRFGRPVIKAIGIAGVDDLARAADYVGAADRLLFDARAPAGASRPGGNAMTFDWRLLAGRDWPLPWLLAGGLDAGTLAAAVAMSGARAVDVSSGVEDAPGRKSPARIRAFLAAAARLDGAAAGVAQAGVPAS